MAVIIVSTYNIQYVFITLNADLCQVSNAVIFKATHITVTFNQSFASLAIIFPFNLGEYVRHHNEVSNSSSFHNIPHHVISLISR